MNAEALLGTVLGTCTLQKLVGQGGMGAVFLAQQSRPKRQVAVKVLLPMTPLSPNQLAAFLERFRRETDAAASLEHPNIMPVYEYGERDGLAYLVMPYISGGTLRDELEREGPLPLDKAMHYLEQLAAAIDVAHEHGVVHRDIKPANIMKTPEGRLLLTDFGLVKIISEDQAQQIRLTGAGAPVGTPDYMAPEQVIGEDVDPRADLYSLGVILYQMVTGTTPFHGETPMQIAAQHLQIPPPSPQMLRPDLPAASEQVILRALAKRPAERYMSGHDIVEAFRASLLDQGVQLPSTTLSNVPRVPTSDTTGRVFASNRKGGLLDPQWQSEKLNKTEMTGSALPYKTASTLPKVKSAQPAARGGYTRGGLLSRTGKFPKMQNHAELLAAAMAQNVAVAADQKVVPVTPDSQSLQVSQKVKRLPPAESVTSGNIKGANNAYVQALDKQEALAPNTSKVKLTGPVKVVKVPIAGQPGRYVTGIVPAIPKNIGDEGRGTKKWVRILVVAIAVLLIVGALLAKFVFGIPLLGGQQTPTNDQGTNSLAQNNGNKNVLLSDPLSKNVNNWLETPPEVYSFKDGAYHIAVHSETGGSAAILQGKSFSGPLVYSLTMQEVVGNDTVTNNSFGMIFRFNQQTVDGNTITMFYTFEVVNANGGGYQFWKYDDSQGKANAWTPLLPQPIPLGDEYHLGHGPQASNTFTVAMNGDMFTFTVNGKKLATAKDGAIQNGMVGMIVNLDGTEVAFKNLLITRA